MLRWLQRTAVASARVQLGRPAFDRVAQNELDKVRCYTPCCFARFIYDAAGVLLAWVQGDVLVAAQLAGIQAAKLTAQLIPLCHSINLRHARADLYRVASTHAHTLSHRPMRTR